MKSILLLPLSLLSCGDDEPVERTPITLQPGAPVAGVAEAPIDFPIGSPMGGFSSRCKSLGGDGRVDDRQSAYTEAFTSSAGIQTQPMAKALWLENGDQHFILLKADVIYMYDGLVEEVERRLEEATGEDLDGRIAIATSHTHNAPANFSDQIHFYLGGDRYNEEIFQRFAASLEATALAAYESRQPASVGVGIAKDWDPNDLVYSDRRPENDALAVWDDAAPGMGKDPHLYVMRVDTADGQPLGVFFNFGIHGTSLGGDNAMMSVDAPGHVEQVLQDRFDTPVIVAHLQGAGGDAAPMGSGGAGHDYARMESIGEYAAGAIYDLWAATPTSAEPLTLETVTRAQPQSLEEVRVTRAGAVDWYYAPFNPDEGFKPDDIIYDENGDIVSPIDEFNVQYGGVFCGYDDPLFTVGTIGSEVPPYDGCMNVELISFLINGMFNLDNVEGGVDGEDFWPDAVTPLPMPDSLRANTTAARVGPLPIRAPDGTEVSEDFYLGFFPGEITAMYTEQFRRRAAAELDLPYAMAVGYAQDHEGYLLIPEDWLLGGYEPNINLWGPLQGEHLLEGVLDMSAEHLTTDLLEDQDPLSQWQIPDYPDRDLPTLAPDDAPAAGTVPSELPLYVYNPLGLTPEAGLALGPPAQVARGQMAQLIWEGGDPGVDTPLVVLERQEGAEWVEVTTASGRPVTSGTPDILLAYTPDPLFPFTAPQQHLYWAAWQAVEHSGDRAGLPEGTYRLRVYGETYAGGAATWPWPTSAYEVISAEFEVVPAELSVSVLEGQVQAWLQGPADGFRLIDIDGSARGANPLQGATLRWIFEDDSAQDDPSAGVSGGGVTTFAASAPEGAIYAEVEDQYGNVGRVAL